MRTDVKPLGIGDEFLVEHRLEEGEEWQDFGMAQPNRLFTHNLLAQFYCPACVVHAEQEKGWERE